MIMMRMLVWAGFVLPMAVPAAAQQSGAGARVDRLVERYRLDRKVPGLAVAVVRNGVVIKAKGYGVSNLELGSPVTPKTLFGLGSISKQFAATAIMQLVEDGKVSLDESVARYVDSLPAHWGRITVRHLLNHTSGLPEEHWNPSYIEFDRFEHHHLDVLRTVFADSLEFPPGAGWAYRNSAYRLAGMIIEKVSGESFWSFLDRRTFRPIGMTATRSSDPKSIIPNRAKGYGKDRGRIANRDAVTETAAFSEGALMSSVLDMAKWDSALYRPRVLSQASLDQMWTPTTLADGSVRPYGLGWFLSPTNGVRTVSHGGALPGFVTNISRFVGKGLTVIVLGNAEWANPAALADAIAGIYDPDLAPKPPALIADTDPSFTTSLRAMVEGLGRGELDQSRLGPDARETWGPAAVAEAARLIRRLGKVVRLDLVGRFDRGEVTQRRYRVGLEHGAVVVTALTDGTPWFRSLDVEESLIPR